MLMLGRCLPHIVPNVLLAKREVTNDLLTQQPRPISHHGFHVHCGQLFTLMPFSIQHWINLFSPLRYTLSLFLPPPHRSVSLLFCSLMSSLAFLHASHCSDREWLRTSARWVEHMGTHSCLPPFLHYTCDLWPFSWFGFSSPSFFIADISTFVEITWASFSHKYCQTFCL